MAVPVGTIQFLLSLALLWLCAAPLQAQRRAGPEQDYAAARRVLEAAIRATGDSAALARLGTLTTSFCARAVEVGQSAAPDAPSDTIVASGRRIYDLTHHRYAQDWSTEFRGGIPLALHEIVTDSGAYSTDLRGGVVFAVAPAGLAASQRRVEDNAPYAPLVLLDRARRNAATLRIIRGGSGIPGTDAALFSDRGFLLTLSFDRRSHLLVSAEALVDNWAVGLAPLRFDYGSYRRVGPVLLATRLTTWFRDSLLTVVRFPDLARPAAITADAFRLPDTAGAVTVGGPLNITIDSVAPHAFMVRYGQTGGPNFGYNPPFADAQLVVELQDGLLLVDAPWYPSVQQSVIDRLATLFPNKPVKMVTFTHYHSDHFGGLRPYIKPGVTFVTTPGNRPLIERVARALHPSDLSPTPPVPRIETFTGRRTIDDAESPVELREIETGHAKEMVVAYLPRQHILFTADLFGIFPVRGGPAGSYPSERKLAEYVEKQGWKVDKIVSGHGAISSGSELEGTIRMTPSNPRPPSVMPKCRIADSG